MRERLAALVLQHNRLRWYGHVLRKEDDDWVKKCMEYEVKSPKPRRRPKRTWREVVEMDCQARKLNKVDAMDHSKWRKLIKDVWWSGWVWVGECFFWYRPTRVVSDQRPLNGCVCVCVCFWGIWSQLDWYRWFVLCSLQGVFYVMSPVLSTQRRGSVRASLYST